MGRLPELIEILKIITHMTPRAVVTTRAFRVDLAARLYFHRHCMDRVGPVETFDGTLSYLWDSARLYLLEVSEDGDESESRPSPPWSVT